MCSHNKNLLLTRLGLERLQYLAIPIIKANIAEFVEIDIKHVDESELDFDVEITIKPEINFKIKALFDSIINELKKEFKVE